MKNFGAPLKIGVISDIHAFLRPEVFKIFKNVDHIVLAGDICSDEILPQLQKIAPVAAVRGNSDFTPNCRNLPLFDFVRLGPAEIFLTHGHVESVFEKSAGANIFVRGHTHRPKIEFVDGALHINPGSAGPRRGNLPISVALLTIFNRARSAEIVEIFPRERDEISFF